MRLLVRIVAVLAAVSVLGTVWFVAAFAAAGELQALLTSGLLGSLTIVGWVITLVVGPVATVQLWRFRQSGRSVPASCCSAMASHTILSGCSRFNP